MTDEELVEQALAMREYSYAPYSHFAVGAALLCEDGTVFTGCNVENAAYGSTLCAERTALVKAVSEGRPGGWVTLAIAGSGEDFCWPCGACRQMLYEFAPRLRVLAANRHGRFCQTDLAALLPMGFGPSSLKEKGNDAV